MKLPKPKSIPGMALYGMVAIAILLIGRVLSVFLETNFQKYLEEKKWDSLFSAHWPDLQVWLMANMYILSVSTALVVGMVLGALGWLLVLDMDAAWAKNKKRKQGVDIPELLPAEFAPEALLKAQGDIPEAMPIERIDIKLNFLPSMVGDHNAMLDITARKKVGAVVVLVRHAVIIHYLSHAAWKWSNPSRLAEAASMVPGEVLSVPYFFRQGGSVDQETHVTLFGASAIRGDAEQPDGCVIIRLQVIVHFDNATKTFDEVWQYRRMSGKNYADILDSSKFDYLKNENYV